MGKGGPRGVAARKGATTDKPDDRPPRPIVSEGALLTNSDDIRALTHPSFDTSDFDTSDFGG
jgi:hypothetical protein